MKNIDFSTVPGQSGWVAFWTLITSIAVLAIWVHKFLPSSEVPIPFWWRKRITLMALVVKSAALAILICVLPALAEGVETGALSLLNQEIVLCAFLIFIFILFGQVVLELALPYLWRPGRASHLTPCWAGAEDWIFIPILTFAVVLANFAPFFTLNGYGRVIMILATASLTGSLFYLLKLRNRQPNKRLIAMYAALLRGGGFGQEHVACIGGCQIPLIIYRMAEGVFITLEDARRLRNDIRSTVFLLGEQGNSEFYSPKIKFKYRLGRVSRSIKMIIGEELDPNIHFREGLRCIIPTTVNLTEHPALKKFRIFDITKEFDRISGHLDISRVEGGDSIRITKRTRSVSRIDFMEQQNHAL